MQKIKTVCKISLFLAMLVPLTGCWDAEELEDNAYVIGLGLDRSEKEDKVQVTMLVANPEVGSAQGGGGSIEQPKEIITFDANDFIAAKSTANVIISRDLSYELLKVIVASEEFAKDESFFRWISNALTDKEIRLDTHLAVSKEKANEYFLNNKPKMETRPHKYFQFMIDHGIENGLIPDSTLFRFFKTTTKGTDLFLAMYTTTQKEKNPKIQEEDEYTAGQVDATGDIDSTQFIGSAVFKDGIMIDKLNGQDTRIINILDDTTNIEDLLVNIPDPFSEKQQIAVRMLKTKDNKVKMNVKGRKPKITITIPVNFEILTNPSRVNYARNEKKQQELKNHLADYMKTNYEDFFKRTQTELRGVPYPLSIYSRKYFGTIQEYEKFNWNKSYLEADITIKPEIEIIDYGKQIKTPKEREE